MKSRRSSRQWPLARWFLLPGLLLAAYLAVPVFRLLATSPRHLWSALLEPEVRNSLLLTFGCSLLSTLIGLVFSVPLGYALAREHFRGRRMLMALMDMPLVVPHPVAGIALLLLFSRGAWAGHLLERIHLHLVGTVAGIVAAMLFISVPYLIHSCRDGFREVDIRYEQLARTLGCGRWQAFWRVAFPLARRHILSGAILTFARAVSEFGSLVILVYNPRVISILIFDRFNNYGLEGVLPVAALLILFGFVVIWAVSRLEGVQP